MNVREISRSDCEDYVLNVHYSKRWPSISYAYGLFEGEELVGVVTYGTPSSPTLRSGVAGEAYKGDVLELNRLVLRHNRKNEASFLVGSSLKMLPKGKIVVSYADISQNHTGYVYQATNFIYCGLSARRTDIRIRGKEHLHSQTIVDEFRGVPNRTKAIKDKYGDLVYYEPRSRKHRYVYITGSRTFKKHTKKALKYKIEDYPKGDIKQAQ